VPIVTVCGDIYVYQYKLVVDFKSRPLSIGKIYLTNALSAFALLEFGLEASFLIVRSRPKAESATSAYLGLWHIRPKTFCRLKRAPLGPGGSVRFGFWRSSNCDLERPPVKISGRNTKRCARRNYHTNPASCYSLLRCN